MAKRDMQLESKVIAAIQDGKRQSVEAIAARLAQRPPNVYAVLRRLEERGEAQRTPGHHGGGNPQLWYIPAGLSLKEARRKSLAYEWMGEEKTLGAKIEKGIPLPVVTRGSGLTRLISQMEPGDSIELPTKLNSSVGSAGRRLKFKIARRRTSNGMARFWRIK